jgi:DNA sulfur modification protein DndD
MIFLELVLQNFGPYSGRQVINLRPDINDNPRPILLFGGMNGGGKTTLIDAIRLALYGHRAQCSSRNNLSYSEFLTQSVNRHTKVGEETCIELAFEHIMNDMPVEFRIKRSWTKNPKTGRDTLGILLDDWPDSALVNTWDERIEELLPLGISNLFLFDGEQVKELAELEAPPPPVVEAIRSLLGLELAEKLAVDLDILVNRKRKTIADVQQLTTLEDIEQKLKYQQQEYDTAKIELSDKQEQLKQAQEKQREASEKFISEGGKIAGERSQLESQIQNYNNNAEVVRDNMIDLAAGTLPLALIQPLLVEGQIQGEKEAKSQQAKIALDVLKERDKRLLDCINELALPSKKIDKIKNFLEQENQVLEQQAGENEKSWLGADTEILNQLNNILNHYQPSQIKLAQEQLNKLKNLEEEIASTERQLAAAASPEAYAQLEEAVRLAQAELAQAKASYEAQKRKCEEISALIEKTKKDLVSYGEQNIDLKNDEHIINVSAKVQATLQLFREKLTLRKLNQLESVVTECFLYLLHKSDLVHRVAIDTYTFSFSLYDLQGKPVPKHRLSAGEKQLLAIAFLWGLARVSGRHLPVAIDTPLGRLDSSHRTNLVERYFPSASHQVILLSTDTEIGKDEVARLREADAIAREYLLKYNSGERQTVVESGYFW